MKSFQIGNTHIIVSHITHFQFTPVLRSEMTEVPAELTIYIDGDKALNFLDAEAEEGSMKLKEVFEGVTH